MAGTTKWERQNGRAMNPVAEWRARHKKVELYLDATLLEQFEQAAASRGLRPDHVLRRFMAEFSAEDWAKHGAGACCEVLTVKRKRG